MLVMIALSLDHSWAGRKYLAAALFGLAQWRQMAKKRKRKRDRRRSDVDVFNPCCQYKLVLLLLGRHRKRSEAD